MALRTPVSALLTLLLLSPLAAAPALAQVDGEQPQSAESSEQRVSEQDAPEQNAAPDQPPVDAAEPTPQPAPRPDPRPLPPTSSENSLLKTAEDQYANGEFDVALRTLEQLLAKQQSQPARQAETYNLIGLVQDRRDRFEDSSAAYQKALALYQGLDNSDDAAKQGEAKTLNNLGTLYAAEQRIPEALGFFERSLGLSRRLKARGNEAITLRNLGNLYLQVDRFEEAIAFLEDSLAIEVELQRPSQIVAILDRLSNIYDAVGALPKAIVAVEEALKIVETTPDDEAKLVMLDRLAGLYADAGSSSKAVANYEKALVLIQRANEPILEGRLRNRMASLYAALDQTDQALAQYRAVLAIATSTNDSLSQARILTSIGDLYRNSEQWGLAQDSYNQALGLIEPLEDATTKPIAQGRLFSALAAIAKEQSNWDEALDLAQKALAAQQVPTADSETDSETRARLGVAQAISLNLLGDIYAQQQKYDPATQAYRQSLTTLGQRGNPILQGTNLSSLGRVLMQQGRPAEAIKPLQEATRIWELIGLEAAQGDDRDLVEDSYRLLVDAQLAQDNPGAALEVVEQQRSRLLRTFLDLRQAQDAEPTAALNLAQIQQQARQRNATFVVYDSEREATAGSSQLQDKALRIWVVPPSGEVSFERVPLAQPLASLAAQGDQALANLSQLLVEPIQAALPSEANAMVMVVPTSELTRVPFAALPISGGKTLLDRYAIVTLPSIKTLSRPPASRATGPSVTALVAGDPAVSNLRRRPSIARATESVAKILGVEALVGEAATLDAIAPIVSRAKTIHLAVPQLRLGNGNEAIAFANPSRVEGITPADILSLKLQADLVTLQGLSAQADRPAEEGFSLSQAFLAAGVPTVVAATDSGDALATQKLMTEFYQRLDASEMTPTQALRQAMLEVRKQHPEPKDWASFVVMGM